MSKQAKSLQPNLDWKLRKWLGDWFMEDNPTQLCNASKELMQFLKNEGVVLKVNRELPPLPANSFEAYSVEAVENKCLTTQNTMLEAGYVATIPLIEEVDKDAV